jgi:hypothetical protein
LKVVFKNTFFLEESSSELPDVKMQSKERERNTEHSLPEVTLAHPKVNQPQQKGLGKY